MKKIFYVIFWSIISINSSVFADDSWVFWSCRTESQIRNWDINIDTIPCLINQLIDVLMGIAWTVSVVFIIIGAYQMLFWSFWKDNSKWKATITYAITWFVLASFSWLIIKFILDNFSK